MDYRVVDLPIEPIEDRYSKQWAQWFPKAYKYNELKHTQIQGSTPETKVSSQHFLDPFATFDWKFSQLKVAVDHIKRIKGMGAVVFLHDAWFPGIECFGYLRDMLNLPIKIVGFWHAGSYEPNDLLGIRGLHQWAFGSEMTWFKLCDAICLGSEYHKSRILASLGSSALDVNKVHVTGYPCEVPFDGKTKKENIVVWPHRISEEKHPEIFDRLSREPRFKGVQFIKSKEVCETKNEYYRLLRRSKVAVSTARLETFGISMVEAALSGCHPVCPNGMSYPETMEPTSLYDSYEEMVGLVQCGLEEPYPYQYVYDFGPEMVTGRICNIIKGVIRK